MVTSLQPSISFGVLLSWNATASTWAAEFCVSSFGSKKNLSLRQTDRHTVNEFESAKTMRLVGRWLASFPSALY